MADNVDSYFVLGLLFGIIVTFVLFSIFPVAVAIIRKTVITEKAYRGLCYKLNLMMVAIELIFSILIGNGIKIRIWPYLIWTEVAACIGRAILKRKGLLVKDLPKDKAGVTRQEVLDNQIPTSDQNIHEKRENSFCEKNTSSQGKSPDSTQVNQTIPRTDIMAHKCVNCGSQILENDKFCSSCGQKIEKTIQARYCRYCGTPIEPGFVFCRKCGKRLEE